MKKLLLIVCMLFIFSTIANGGAFFSANSGKLLYPSTWSNNPNSTDIPDSTSNEMVMHNNNMGGEASQEPIAYWKLDEILWDGTANEVIDETGNFYGTANGAVITTSGKFDNAGSFDGSNDYIGIDSSLSPSGDMTISAWAMSYGVTKSDQWYNDYIITKGNDLAGTTNSWGLHFNTAENDSPISCALMLVTDQELTWVTVPYGSIQKNEWYFITGVVKADTAYLYLNGVLSSQKQIAGSISPSNLNVNIGKMDRPGAEYFFNGLIDEVKVFDGALSSEEIRAEYLVGAEEFIITNVAITNINATQTKVEWQTTVPATGFIFYAENDASSGYPFEAMETDGLVLEHSMTLDTLHTGSTYYFIIDQNDEGWTNNVRSEEFSFVAGDLPPAKPAGLVAFVPNSGVYVQLTWNKNSESDLSYYSIYKYDSLLTTTTDTTFTDNEVIEAEYMYKVTATDLNGNESDFSETVSVIVGVETETNLPTNFSLYQNYPNPFNPSTTIKYSIPVAAGKENIRSVQLIVYNMLGQKVATLVNQKQAPGRYEVIFNADQLASGTYIYRIIAGSFVAIKKLILIK